MLAGVLVDRGAAGRGLDAGDTPADLVDPHGDARFRTCVLQYAEQLQQQFGDAPVLFEHGRALAAGLDRRMNATRLPRKASTKLLLVGAGFGSSGTRTIAQLLARAGLTVFHASDILSPAQPDFSAKTSRHSKMTHAWRDQLVHAERLARRADPEGARLLGDSAGGRRVCFQSLDRVDWAKAATWQIRPDAIVDSPSAEYFLDLYRALPRVSALLTLREPASWVDARRLHCNGAVKCNMRAPVDRPCNLRMQHVSRAHTVALYGLHAQLVRCVVPPDRLLEVDFSRRPTDAEVHARVQRFVHGAAGAPLDRPLWHGSSSAALKQKQLTQWMQLHCCKMGQPPLELVDDCVSHTPAIKCRSALANYQKRQQQLPGARPEASQSPARRRARGVSSAGKPLRRDPNVTPPPIREAQWALAGVIAHRNDSSLAGAARA